MISQARSLRKLVRVNSKSSVPAQPLWLDVTVIFPTKRTDLSESPSNVFCFFVVFFFLSEKSLEIRRHISEIYYGTWPNTLQNNLALAHALLF